MEIENIELKREAFLKSKFFYELTNLNDGFDAKEIYYFSEEDFEIILDRIEIYGVGIYGIEPFLNGEFYGVNVHEQFDTVPNDPSWYRLAFNEFKKSNKNLQYSATYDIPDGLLNN